VPCTTAGKSGSGVGVGVIEEVEERDEESESGSGGECSGEAMIAESWVEEAEPRTRALGQGGNVDGGGVAIARSPVLSAFTRAIAVSSHSTRSYACCKHGLGEVESRHVRCARYPSLRALEIPCIAMHSAMPDPTPVLIMSVSGT